MLINHLENLRQIIRWHDIVDILIVSVFIYRLLILIRGTRAVQMLTGLGIVLILYSSSEWLKLHTIHTILVQFFNNLIIILIIVFQDEIKKALTQVGRNPFFASSVNAEQITVVDDICDAASRLAPRHIGALIVIERETGLKNYIEAGTTLDALISSDLIVTIFQPVSPIHDGAIIIRDSRLSSAGCLLPISRDPALDKELGTRHRAALGLTLETDAVVIVVSEERGEISLAHQGKLKRNLDKVQLKKYLTEILEPTFETQDSKTGEAT